MKTIVIDIETIPSENKPDPSTIKYPSNYKDPEVIRKYQEAKVEEEWADEALCPEKGRIFCIGLAIGDDEPMVLYGPDMLDQLDSLLASIGDSYTLVGHHIKTFDIPFIYKNALRQQLYHIPKRWSTFGRYTNEVIDINEIWNLTDYRQKTSIENIANFLGITNTKGQQNGSHVFEMYKEGKYEEIYKYCICDVLLEREVYKRLSYFR